MIRSVGFDLGDTLIEYEGVALNWEREYPVALAAVATLWCDAPTDFQMSQGIAALMRYNTRRVPRVSEVDHATVFSDVLNAMGAPPEQVSALTDPAADVFFGVFQRHARAFPETRSVIDALAHDGVGLGVLTDVPYGMPRRLVLADLQAARLSSLDSALLTSTEVGTRKPDPTGFARLASHMGCAPGQMLFVGNEQKDISGALAAGMRAILVSRDGASPPAWGQHASITSLSEIHQLLATF